MVLAAAAGQVLEYSMAHSRRGRVVGLLSAAVPRQQVEQQAAKELAKLKRAKPEQVLR
jgi:hypothetical protein